MALHPVVRVSYSHAALTLLVLDRDTAPGSVPSDLSAPAHGHLSGTAQLGQPQHPAALQHPAHEHNKFTISPRHTPPLGFVRQNGPFFL